MKITVDIPPAMEAAVNEARAGVSLSLDVFVRRALFSYATRFLKGPAERGDRKANSLLFAMKQEQLNSPAGAK